MARAVLNGPRNQHAGICQCGKWQESFRGRPTFGHVSGNGDQACECTGGTAGAGQSIIYQPHFIVGEAVARGDLTVLSLDKPVVELGGIHVLYLPDRRPPAKVRVMIDYLVEAFARMPP